MSCVVLMVLRMARGERRGNGRADRDDEERITEWKTHGSTLYCSCKYNPGVFVDAQPGCERALLWCKTLNHSEVHITTT